MKEDIRDMVRACVHTGHMHVDHVRQPRQGYPVTGVRRRESPGDALAGQASGDIRIVPHIERVVERHKVVVSQGPVDGQCDRDQNGDGSEHRTGGNPSGGGCAKLVRDDGSRCSARLARTHGAVAMCSSRLHVLVQCFAQRFSLRNIDPSGRPFLHGIGRKWQVIQHLVPALERTDLPLSAAYGVPGSSGLPLSPHLGRSIHLRETFRRHTLPRLRGKMSPI